MLVFTGSGGVKWVRTMAASPSVTEELTCSICLELFEEPVLLPCAHTFCRQCLRDFCARRPSSQGTATTGIAITGRDSGGGNGTGTGTGTGNGTSSGSGSGSGSGTTVLLCPKCRANVKLGAEGIDGLPKNTTLANIILSFDEEGQRQKNTPCDVCDSDPPRNGFKSCSDCTLTFCRTCFAQLHPLRGAFTHHVITSPAPTERKDQWEDMLRSPRSETRLPLVQELKRTRSLVRVRSMSPHPKEQEYMENIRKSITRKRKELKETLKEAQDLLKSTEDETEDQMKHIKSLSSKLHEGVAEKEGAMLAACTRRRHEAVTCCYGLISDAQAQLLELDLLDEKFGQLLVKGPIMDISHELSCLEERLAVLSSIQLEGRLDDVPRPRQLQTVHVKNVLSNLDFKQETDVVAPVITDILSRPVAKGPAVVDIKWTEPQQGLCYRLTAWRKTQKGRTERVIVDEVTGGSQLMLLPGIDSQYRLSVTVLGKAGEVTVQGDSTPTDRQVVSEEKAFRTLPYVNCISIKIDPANCHKVVAVTSNREEVMHRKCRLSNLNDTHPPATSRRLDELEGAMGENPFPPLPHMYWENVIHFHIISKLEDSKLVCDVGVCKAGMEDACGLVCDNPKSYCCYLVRRNRFITLEFWNGPNQEILARSLNVADLDKENEKTLRLGFYLDVARRVLAVINPAASTILAHFNIKFTSLVWLCGVYCPDQVYATVKHVSVNNIPTVVAKLVAKSQAAAANVRQ
ncbi:uncharacterized protein LOC143291086 isoform X2 [Babylonia areolata]|uniref:uncharacterized protein LOC143291086 isoform X2 n=1 Tax=Babylonia areolata TaxID=304850 RepID=UPI003FCFB1E5